MIQNVYFLGIGGIGMSALARYYKHSGCQVAGYDLTPSALTQQLEEEGIAIHYKDSPSAIPAFIRNDYKHTLVIYTPAIAADNREMTFLSHGPFRLIKRSVALGHIAQNHCTLAVAGTHGKTTTSTLLAHILQCANKSCTAFLGGISKNYHSNLLLGKGEALVAEADEFDRSFLQLHPQYALITSIEADHLDIYGTPQAVRDAFAEFALQIPENGTLVVKKQVNTLFHLQKGVKQYTYALEEPCDFYASALSPTGNGYYRFTLNHLNGQIEGCTLGIPGKIHIENAVGASALALLYGVSPQILKTALATFEGVQRRMDVRYKSDNCCYIDDYAHHPQEIQATLESVREFYPGQKITGIFQPHLYTRTRDFYHEFAKSLSLLDRVLLLPIYPAREEPIDGVDSEMILKEINLEDKALVAPEQVCDLLSQQAPQVLLTMGAGNIDRLVAPIVETLNKIQA